MKSRLMSLVLFLSWVACKYEPVIPDNPTVSTNCSPDTVYFKQVIEPLLNTSCGSSGCHDAASSKDGVVMTGYSNILKEVTKGNASKSKLYEVITDDDPSDRMPPSAPLSSSQINSIYTWINQGAKDNSCADTSCNTTNVSYSQTVVPTLSTYCNGCHGASSYQSNGAGINLSSYDKVKIYVNNGKLVGSIEHNSSFSAMPKGGSKLSNCKIDQIKSWVSAGALNN